MFYVLTESAAIEAGILTDDGGELRHEATEREIAALAESEHATEREAVEAAVNTDDDRWVIDEDGNSAYVPGADTRI